jgi:hypothetical protein
MAHWRGCVPGAGTGSLLHMACMGMPCIGNCKAGIIVPIAFAAERGEVHIASRYLEQPRYSIAMQRNQQGDTV